MKHLLLFVFVILVGWGIGFGGRQVLIVTQLAEAASNATPYISQTSGTSLGGSAGSCN